MCTFNKDGAVQVALWHGLVMGGGAGLTVAGTFRVATEKTVSHSNFLFYLLILMKKRK